MFGGNWWIYIKCENSNNFTKCYIYSLAAVITRFCERARVNSLLFSSILFMHRKYQFDWFLVNCEFETSYILCWMFRLSSSIDKHKIIELNRIYSVHKGPQNQMQIEMKIEKKNSPKHCKSNTFMRYSLRCYVNNNEHFYRKHLPINSDSEEDWSEKEIAWNANSKYSWGLEHKQIEWNGVCMWD